jgi:hypothetical protein
MGNSSEGSEEGAVYQEMMDCNRSFSNEEALEQHRRDSPAHDPYLGRVSSVVLVWSGRRHKLGIAPGGVEAMLGALRAGVAA